MTEATIRETPLDLAHLTLLLQLSSPALPIGGFTYSQGLEAAVELRLIRDEATADEWIAAQLHNVMTEAEGPLWSLMYRAWYTHDLDAARYWNEWFHASRETQEIRQETEQMGRSLARLAHALQWGSDTDLEPLQAILPVTLPLVHSFACAIGQIPERAGLSAYLFAWLENQVTAAVKTVPLGQTAGQRILSRQRQRIPSLVEDIQRRSRASPPLLHTLAPQSSIVSSRHATQFSRLFRS